MKSIIRISLFSLLVGAVSTLPVKASGKDQHSESAFGDQSDQVQRPTYSEKDPGKIDQEFKQRLKDAYKNGNRHGGMAGINFRRLFQRANSLSPEAKTAFIEAMMAQEQAGNFRGNSAKRKTYLGYLTENFHLIADENRRLAAQLSTASLKRWSSSHVNRNMGGGQDHDASGGHVSRGRSEYNPGDDFINRTRPFGQDNDNWNTAAGDHYRNTGRPEQAAEYYKRATEQNSGNGDAYSGLAQVLAQPEIGDWQGAWEAGNKALELGNRDPGLVASMRLTKQRLGTDGVARGSTGPSPTALRSNFFQYEDSGSGGDLPVGGKKITEALMSVQASEKLVKRDPKRALALARKAARAMPESSRAYLAEANALLRMKRFQEAREALRNGILFAKPSMLSTLYTKEAEILNRMGRSKDALASAKLAIAANLNNANAFAQASWAFAGLGDNVNAIDSMRSAANLNGMYRRHLTEMQSLPEDGDMLALFEGRSQQTKTASQAAPADHSIFKNKKAMMWLAMAAAICFLGLGIVGALSDSFKDTIRRKLAGSAAPRVETADGFQGMAGAEAGQRARDELLGGVHRIEGEIGAGGMGVVYKAHDTQLDRSVAVKKMREEIRSDPRERERFLKEARMVAALRNANIVEIYQILEKGQDVFLVFEFVSGKTISQLIYENKKMTLPDSLLIVKGIASALDFAHTKNVIHRDLKPSNVMINDEGEVKVMDFGVARQAKESVSRLSMTNSVVGTPPYMAPEQEQGMVRKESDVFALAVCLYEMLTGELPYRGVGAGMLMAKMNQTYAPASRIASGLPAEFDGVMAKGLEPDPDKRWKTGGEFLRALEQLVPVS